MWYFHILQVFAGLLIFILAMAGITVLFFDEDDYWDAVLSWLKVMLFMVSCLAVVSGAVLVATWGWV
jgi:hypothetical protein